MNLWEITLSLIHFILYHKHVHKRRRREEERREEKRQEEEKIEFQSANGNHFQGQ